MVIHVSLLSDVGPGSISSSLFTRFAVFLTFLLHVNEPILCREDEEMLTLSQLNDLLVYETHLAHQAGNDVRKQYRMDYHEHIRSRRLEPSLPSLRGGGASAGLSNCVRRRKPKRGLEEVATGVTPKNGGAKLASAMTFRRMEEGRYPGDRY